MRVIMWAALAAVVATAPAGAAPRPGEATARREIETGERAWGQAFVHGDAAALERLLADDFVGISPGGKTYTKAQMLKDLRTDPHETADRIDGLSVRFYGDTAIAQAHEHVVGPPPELEPSETVFTDTWVRRGGRWRVVAAEDLDPGAGNTDGHAADAAAIRAVRDRSNRAIAEHDMRGFTPAFADDAVFVWSNGSSAIGKAGLTTFFAQDFADPHFDRYVRSPARVSVAANGVRAIEHGTWTALKHDGAGQTRYGGDYSAHWMKKEGAWKIVGELYVKLRCEGSLCTP